MDNCRRGQRRLALAPTSAGAVGAALVLAIALALLPAAGARAALPDAEARMLGHINGARASNGLAKLTPNDGLRKVARGWAAQMASDYESSGDRQQTLRHNPSLSSQLPGSFRRAGENVGYTVLTDASHATLVDRLHDSYMASAPHRANILGEFDRVGVGLVTSDDGTMWSAVVFMLEKAAPQPDPEPDGGGGEEQRDRSEDGGKSHRDGQRSGGRSEPSAASEAQPASHTEPAREPPPAEAPTTKELFGSGWPEGYLAGDRDAALALLAQTRDVRRAVSVAPRPPAPAAPRLLRLQVTGLQ